MFSLCILILATEALWKLEPAYLLDSLAIAGLKLGSLIVTEPLLLFSLTIAGLKLGSIIVTVC